MKKLINDPATLLEESLDGFAAVHADLVEMDAARRFSPEFCAKAAELVMETDYRMKTSFDDADRLLEMLILQLAQEARRG